MVDRSELVDPDTVFGHDCRAGIYQKLGMALPRRPRQGRIDK